MRNSKYNILRGMMRTLTQHRAVMSLIRGPNGKCPCPVCLVTGENIMNHLVMAVLRADEQGEHIVNDDTTNKKTKEAKLKILGLRNVKVSAQNV